MHGDSGNTCRIFHSVMAILHDFSGHGDEDDEESNRTTKLLISHSLAILRKIQCTEIVNIGVFGIGATIAFD